MYLGILIIVMVLPKALIVKENPEAILQQAKPEEPNIPLGTMLKSRLLLIGNVCSIGAAGGTSQNLK
jgi:hypothetical protein